MFHVNSIYQTIQGEGEFTGIPVTLIRFQGCNMDCPFCDTPQAKSRDTHVGEHLSLEQVLQRVDSFQVDTSRRTFLLTGGEPLVQPELKDLIRPLFDRGSIHIETNASLPVVFDDWMTYIVASPKSANSVNSDTIRLVNAIKWVVGDDSDLAELDRFLDLYENKLLPYTPIMLQPMSQGEEATELCYVTCLERGYRLSLQTHKYIGIE